MHQENFVLEWITHTIADYLHNFKVEEVKKILK